MNKWSYLAVAINKLDCVIHSDERISAQIQPLVKTIKQPEQEVSNKFTYVFLTKNRKCYGSLS